MIPINLVDDKLINTEHWNAPFQIVFQEQSYSNLHSIVEETLTSGKYVLLFLISILYIYIYLKKLRDNPHIF